MEIRKSALKELTFKRKITKYFKSRGQVFILPKDVVRHPLGGALSVGVLGLAIILAFGTWLTWLMVFDETKAITIIENDLDRSKFDRDVAVTVFIYGQLDCSSTGVSLQFGPAGSVETVAADAIEELTPWSDAGTTTCKVDWNTPDVGSVDRELYVHAVAPPSANSGLTFVSAWYWRVEARNSMRAIPGQPARNFFDGFATPDTGYTFCNSTTTVSATLTLSKFVDEFHNYNEMVDEVREAEGSTSYGIDLTETQVETNSQAAADDIATCTSGPATLAFSISRPFNMISRMHSRATSITLLFAEMSTLLGLYPFTILILAICRVQWVKHGRAMDIFDRWVVHNALLGGDEHTVPHDRDADGPQDGGNVEMGRLAPPMLMGNSMSASARVAPMSDAPIELTATKHDPWEMAPASDTPDV